MPDLLHELISASAESDAAATALVCGGTATGYGDLERQIRAFGGALTAAGLEKQDRVAIYLPKIRENVVSMFGTAAAGGIFVPVNPVLKAEQVAHILRDSGATTIVTSEDRLKGLDNVLESCKNLSQVILTSGNQRSGTRETGQRIFCWDEFVDAASHSSHRIIDADVAAILYTSGSTGKPKGVVLSHRNMVSGAISVSQYLGNRRGDRLLAVLPLSFDAGFSQLSTAFCSGASVVLHDFFFAADIVKVVSDERITGLTAVPPLWSQIADAKWPPGASDSVRYFANTGGKMPRKLLSQLRQIFPAASPFLMYGLTEAFRSTYLPPEEIDRRPDSIGKAIPNAEILVLREDGSECDAGEPGELVHRGALVAQGYWNAPERSKERFRSLPARLTGVPIPETAVWSGDAVMKDEEGFLFFVGRKDDMIKTSGYRVSPTEVEELGFESGLVKEIAAIGVADEKLGQKVVAVAVPSAPGKLETATLLAHFADLLPTYMVPHEIQWRDSLPRTANGKIDRQKLAKELNS